MCSRLPWSTVLSPIIETALILAAFATVSFGLSELFVRRTKAAGEIQRSRRLLPTDSE